MPEVTPAGSPSEILEKRKARAQEREEQEQQVRLLFNRIAEGEFGVVFFQHLARMCGFPQNPVVMRGDANGVQPLETTTLYNATLLGLYFELRRYLSPANRTRIESEL